jgi:iron(III) transport system ATP-binding protein
MRSARVAQDGTPRELYNAPASRFVADFMGDANLLEATVGEHHSETAKVSVGPLSLDLPHRGIAPGPAALAVRPHSVRLTAGSAGRGGIEGQVTKAAYLGDHMEYMVATVSPKTEIFATAADVNRPHAVGADVAVHLDPESIVLVGND